MREIREGKRQYRPDRERDFLTLALENPKKGGRTRGLGISYPWKIGFEADKDTYRSRARAKQRQEEQEQDKYNQLLARIEEHQRQIDDLRASR